MKKLQLIGNLANVENALKDLKYYSKCCSKIKIVDVSDLEMWEEADTKMCKLFVYYKNN